MSRRKKAIFDVDYRHHRKQKGKRSPIDRLSGSTRRRRGRKQLAESMNFFGDEKKKKKRRGKSFFGWFSNQLSDKPGKAEYYQERQEVLDDLDNNPNALLRRIKENRLAAQWPWVRQVAGWLATLANRNRQDKSNL